MTVTLMTIGVLLVVAGAVIKFGCLKVGLGILAFESSGYILNVLLTRRNKRSVYSVTPHNWQ